MNVSYDKENRMQTHTLGEMVTSFTYHPDGLKFTEKAGASATTIVWDGSEYLQERD